MKFEVYINLKIIGWNKKKTDETRCKQKYVGNHMKFEENLIKFEENLIKFEVNINLLKIGWKMMKS